MTTFMTKARPNLLIKKNEYLLQVSVTKIERKLLLCVQNLIQVDEVW